MLSRKAPRFNVQYSSAAAKSVADCEDLLLDILLLLPIRSLVRFKCVSKRWLSLITDPGFCHRRSTFHPPTPSGIFLRSCPRSAVFDFVDLRPNPPRVPIESLEFSVPKHGIVIQQSCNGLLLCCNEGQSHPKSDYYVYNPTTKQYRTLPKIQTEEDSAIAGLSLAFDPLRSSNYKVVCVRVLDSNNYQIEIYSSGSDADLWKPAGGRFPPPQNTLFDFGIYWNGAVHWPRKWENCVYLDLCEEKLHELPMPGAYDDWEGRRVEYFGNCCGHLHYIESCGRQAVLNVYEMENDRGGWFEKYRVDLHTVSDLFPKLISPPPLELSKFTVLAIVDQSEVDDQDPYVVLQGLGKLAVRLNVKTGSFEKLVYILNGGGTTNLPLGLRVIDAFLYIESLACV